MPFKPYQRARPRRQRRVPFLPYALGAALAGLVPATGALGQAYVNGPIPAAILSDLAFGAVSPEKIIMAGTQVGGVPADDSPTLRIDPNTNVQPFGGVVSLSLGGSPLCTGSVIGPNVILTAGHCVDLDADGTVDLHPGQLRVNVNAGASPSAVLAVSEIQVHPEFTGFDNPSVADDLAILRLATPIPSGVPIYSFAPPGLLSTEWVYPVTMVGYGRTGFGETGYVPGSSSTVTKRVGGNLVEVYGTGELEEGDDATVELFGYDFESTASGPSLGSYFGRSVFTAAAGDYYGIIDWTLGNDFETNVGPGDSGGPAFFLDPVTQEYLLAGVNTFVGSTDLGANGAFGTIGGGIWLESYLPWIESFLLPEVPEPGTTFAAASVLVIALVAWRRRGTAPA